MGALNSGCQFESIHLWHLSRESDTKQAKYLDRESNRVTHPSSAKYSALIITTHTSPLGGCVTSTTNKRIRSKQANTKNNQRAQLTSADIAITLVLVTELSPPPVCYRVFPGTFDNILRKKFNKCAYRNRIRPFATSSRVLKAFRVDNALIASRSRHNKCPSGAKLKLFYKRTAITW